MKQNYEIAQLTPEQQVTGGLRTAGYQLGGGIGGLMGAEDPQMKLQSLRKQVLQSIDRNDPKALAEGAQALNQAGDSQGAQALFNAAQVRQKDLQEAEVKQSQITKNLREGKAAANKVVEANGRQYLVDATTGEKIADLGAASDKRSVTNVSLSSTADKSYGTELGGLVAKDDIAMRNSAQAAPDVLNRIEQTRALLDSGRVYIGTGANVKLNVLAFGQALGVTGATENEIITQTQQLQQQRSKAVLNQIKASGLGTGQGFTDKDLKFLENASAGTITLSADTLKEQLKIEEKLARASVKKWNDRVRTLPAGVTGSMGLAPVELPTTRSNPVNLIPTTGGMTGNPLVDKYLVKPAGQ
jgi:hypothetical protein